MKSKSNSFIPEWYPVNSFDKDRLPLEVGVSTLINVFFWRILSILLALIPTLLFMIFAWFLSDFSQILSALLLTLVSIFFILFTFSLFRKETTSIDLFLKRMIDFSFSLLSLITFTPIMLLIGATIKIESKGPVFKSQIRLGKDGKEFKMLKFRTMYEDQDEILAKYPELRENLVQKFKLREDPRITRVGRILRKSNLDEFPQFFNIIKGEMSLVGPRAIVENIFDDNYFIDYKKVKPGLTGLWQISGITTLTDENRSKLDRFYVNNWSLWLDIMILAKTIPAALRQTGAY